MLHLAATEKSIRSSIFSLGSKEAFAPEPNTRQNAVEKPQRKSFMSRTRFIRLFLVNASNSESKYAGISEKEQPHFHQFWQALYTQTQRECFMRSLFWIANSGALKRLHRAAPTYEFRRKNFGQNRTHNLLLSWTPESFLNPCKLAKGTRA
jgi:hypothetical protein